MIFYFSGTGNTHWAAQQIALTTGERLLFIPEEMKGECRYELSAGERIGFCFPVHGWQPPRLVREFIRRLHIDQLSPSEPPYVFALVTCGDSIGRTIEMLQDELNGAGLHIDSAFSLVMPESYVCLPFMYTDTPEREQEKIAVATKELNTYTAMILHCERGEIHTHRGLTPWTFSHVIGAYFNAYMVNDRKFTVDADCCIHCGKCQAVCPTGNLVMQPADAPSAEKLPTWQHDGSCTCCLACYHYCPRHAINYGSITRKRGQYYFKGDKAL